MIRSILLATTAALAAVSAVHAQPTAPHPLAGFYAGIEVGPVSYDTQITFDGVDDPAGRGGTGFAAVLGYNHVRGDWLTGLEASVTGGSVPDPYTFDENVTGFAELDLRRETGVGMSGRVGRLIARRLLLFGSVGYSVASQSVRLDGVPLVEFAGASDAATFGTVVWGGGLEWRTRSGVAFRFVTRRLGGHDLSAADFGAVVSDAGLTRFDVEPRQMHFVFGVTYRF